jgi:hypothetical protein
MTYEYRHGQSWVLVSLHRSAFDPSGLSGIRGIRLSFVFQRHLCTSSPRGHCSLHWMERPHELHVHVVLRDISDYDARKETNLRCCRTSGSVRPLWSDRDLLAHLGPGCGTTRLWESVSCFSSVASSLHDRIAGNMAFTARYRDRREMDEKLGPRPPSHGPRVVLTGLVSSPPLDGSRLFACRELRVPENVDIRPPNSDTKGRCATTFPPAKCPACRLVMGLGAIQIPCSYSCPTCAACCAGSFGD